MGLGTRVLAGLGYKRNFIEGCGLIVSGNVQFTADVLETDGLGDCNQRRPGRVKWYRIRFGTIQPPWGSAGWR